MNLARPTARPGLPIKSAMQAHAHHLGRAFPAFLIEAIETVLEILEEMFAGVEALRRCKAHVIGIERVGDDEMLLAVRLRQEIGQVIGIVVRRIEKAAFFHHQLGGVHRAATGVPAKRALAGHLGVDADGLFDRGALHILGHVLVFHPFETVRCDFPLGLLHCCHLFGRALQGGGHAIDRQRDFARW